MATQSETTSLLSTSVNRDEPEVEVRKEFLDLSSIALQVSLATFARIALYSIDYAFLGHLGTTELAAASLASIWTTVPLLTVWSCLSAIVTLCGQAWGAGNTRLMGIWLQMGLTLVTICTPALMLFNWFVGIGLRASTDEKEVVRLGVRFARILMFSIWPNLANACLRLYFQAMGVMMPTTVVGVITIMVSIAANYIFIYGAFGRVGLGFDGSALATVVASWFQPIALTWYCIVYKKFHLRAWNQWDFNEFTRERMIIFYNNSAPAAVNSLVTNVAASVLSLIAAWFGADIIAANAIVSGFWRLLWALFWGFGMGTQIRVSNLLGANRPKAARLLSILGFICTVITVTLLALGALVIRADVFRLYTDDEDLLNICASVLPIFIVAFMVEATEMVSASVLAAMGQVHITAWTSALATWLVELPTAYIFAVVLKGGFKALWYSICLMEILKLIVYIFVLRRIDYVEMARVAVKNMEVENDNEGVEGGSAAYSPLPTTVMTPTAA
ncbi:putative multi antimicrobial extrusion protein [Plasmopara halstedii]